MTLPEGRFIMGKGFMQPHRGARISGAILFAFGFQMATAQDGLMPSAGVTVTRLTDGSSTYQLSYYDINAYSPVTDRAYVNRRQKGERVDGTWDIVAIDLATGAQKIVVSRRPPDVAAARFDMSSDGRLISYLRMNDAPDSGFDLYGYRLDRPGEFRITRANYSAETPYIKTSPASWDSQTNKFVLAFAVDQQLYIVREDGTSAIGAGPQPVALNDADSSLPFHRIRLNPVYPHLLFYRREGKAEGIVTVGRLPPRMYIADLRSSRPRGVKLFRDGSDVNPEHPGWTPDGRKIAVAAIWTEFPVVDDAGRIPDTLALESSDGRQIGPFGKGDANFPAVVFGTYSADGKKIAIATPSTRRAPGELYLMDSRDGKVRRLCRTNYVGRPMAGQPLTSFVGNTSKILLSTDNSWGLQQPLRPQVYLVDPGAATMHGSN
ncbi:MAG: hypothetical protein ACRER4_01950 [Steroidobacteraceae bacterium]